MNRIKIGNTYIGYDEKPYFIADIAANHDGDIERAFKLIELAKEAGADAAKFQNFKANKIVSRNGFDSMKQLSHQANWNKSVYEVYEDASISEEWTEKLYNHCKKIGIEYMTSPYDFGSVDLVDPYVNAYKIGSGDITWTEILKHIAKKEKPVILATGASMEADVIRAVDAVLNLNNQLILMQCNTNYTASAENYKYINLKVLEQYKKLYPNLILGLSDHTYGHATVLGAIALGARVIEKHFTDDNSRLGPDHKFSMNPETWREMVDRSMELWYALGDGIKRIEKNEEETAIVQRRGLYFRRDMVKDEVICQDDIEPLRPFKIGAVAPYDINQVIGKKLKADVKKDTCLLWEGLE